MHPAFVIMLFIYGWQVFGWAMSDKLNGLPYWLACVLVWSHYAVSGGLISLALWSI